MRPRLIHIFFGLFILDLPASLHARDLPQDSAPPPLSVTYVEGRVEIARDTGVLPAEVPDLLEEGDRLLTGGGRAELVSADGSVVHVDRDTDIRIDTDVRVRLVRGRLLVRTSATSDQLVVATPAGPVLLEPRGEYELIADDLASDTVVAAVEGRARLLTPDREIPIATDDVLRIDPRDLQPRWARGGNPDEFAAWSSSRMRDTARAGPAQPLPPELTPYAQDFAVHGRRTTVAPW